MRNRSLDELIHSPADRRVPMESLMPRRVRTILLVSSLYDSFTFEEDGRLTEALFSEFLELNLRYAPRVDQVASADEALAKLRNDSYDLVISMLRVGEMDVRNFGKAIHEIDPDLPIILLAFNTRELSIFESEKDLSDIDRIFVWLGDVRLFLAIIKYVEDRFNAWHDARTAGVMSIILIEDSVRFYSSYLPMLYTEIVEQTQSLMADGVNVMQKLIRQRARPKILLATTYEEALALFERYREHLLGVITDLRFPRGGKVDQEAGYDFAKFALHTTTDLPVLIQSTTGDPQRARTIGAAYIDKTSPTLLQDVRDFMRTHLGFGDFIFRMKDGTEVARAHDLKSLEDCIRNIPEESLLFHCSRNDVSRWLMARTEFDLSRALRPRRVEEFQGPDEIRRLLLAVLHFRREQTRAGVVADFAEGTFEASSGFVRIGHGSLGGKGRGLAFFNSIINTYKLEGYFPGVRLFVPPTAVISTGVFDEFIEGSGLSSFASEPAPDGEIARAFLEAPFPDQAAEMLRTFLERVRYPLAVRSSSLLEDACYQPFAGIYRTYMIPNRHEDLEVRLAELLNAIRLVYASTYYAEARAYIESTPNRLEEEKMAVVIQQIVGRRHEKYLYPNIAGVARSLNFYPGSGLKAEEGVASAALGLGKQVVDGGRCLRFSPVQPKRLPQFATTKDYLQTAQMSFLAMDLSKPGPTKEHGHVSDYNIASLELHVAENHGTLTPVGAVYSLENDAVYDGLSQQGIRLVTLAGVLKGKLFPLAGILAFLLKVGKAGFSCPVEIEFAVNLAPSRSEYHEFGFLQIRPLVTGMDTAFVDLESTRPEQRICMSRQVLGNGRMDDIHDLVYVRRSTFDRRNTQAIASEIGELNNRLRRENRPYVLAGPGRWGSADQWLGIPVKWPQISGARCIVETPIEDIHVDPSQGTHFFQNLTSFGVFYMTIQGGEDGGKFDYAWLDNRPHLMQTGHIRHLRFEKPLPIAVNSKQGLGVILKPGESIHPGEEEDFTGSGL